MGMESATAWWYELDSRERRRLISVLNKLYLDTKDQTLLQLIRHLVNDHDDAKEVLLKKRRQRGAGYHNE